MVWRVKDNQSESECCFSATRLSPSPASPALLVGFNLSGTLVRVSFCSVLSLNFIASFILSFPIPPNPDITHSFRAPNII